MAKDPHAQAEKVYEQLLELLQDLSAIYTDMSEDDEEDDETVKTDEQDMIEGLVEEAVERGLDEESVERVFKSVSSFVRKVRDE